MPPLSLCGPVLNVRKFSSIPLPRVGQYQELNHGVPRAPAFLLLTVVSCWAEWAHSVPIPDGNTASDLLRSRLAEVHDLTRPFQGRCLFDWCLLHDPVDVPAIGDAFQYVLPGVLEGEPAARDEVDDRSRHKDLTRTSLRRDARADVYGDTGDVVPVDLDLARVDARAYVDAVRSSSQSIKSSAKARLCGRQNSPIRSARSKSGSMRTWRSSARGAGPSASRRSRHCFSSSSGRM